MTQTERCLRWRTGGSRAPPLRVGVRLGPVVRPQPYADTGVLARFRVSAQARRISGPTGSAVTHHRSKVQPHTPNTPLWDHHGLLPKRPHMKPRPVPPSPCASRVESLSVGVEQTTPSVHSPDQATGGWGIPELRHTHHRSGSRASAVSVGAQGYRGSARRSSRAVGRSPTDDHLMPVEPPHRLLPGLHRIRFEPDHRRIAPTYLGEVQRRHRMLGRRMPHLRSIGLVGGPRSSRPAHPTNPCRVRSSRIGLP